MTELLWPMIRNFLVMGILLSTMWHPKKRRKDNSGHADNLKGDDWIDAEYEVIG